MTEERFNQFEKAVLNSLKGLGATVSSLEQRFGKVEERIGRLEERISRLEERMDALESRMDRLESRMDGLESRMDRLESSLLATKAVVDDLVTRVSVVEELVAEIPAMNRRLSRLDKRTKNIEVGLKITQVAVHDLSLGSKKHNKDIDFLMKENLQQSQHISALIKQEEHHDNRIAILFERLVAG